MNQFDAWAKYYDKILIGLGGNEDVEFYKKEAKKAKGRVLEVACGTGRVYLEILKDGVDIHGIDISPQLLAKLKEKARKMNLKPKVKKADMRNFKLKEKYSLIIVPYRSFLHNKTTEDQLKTLKNIKEHLNKGGKLILNFWYPNWENILNAYGKENRREIMLDGERVTVIDKAEFADIINQVIDVKFSMEKNNKTFWRNEFKLAFIYKKEFELLLRIAGFKKWKVYGGYHYGKLTSVVQEMVWIAE